MYLLIRGLDGYRIADTSCGLRKISCWFAGHEGCGYICLYPMFNNFLKAINIF